MTKEEFKSEVLSALNFHAVRNPRVKFYLWIERDDIAETIATRLFRYLPSDTEPIEPLAEQER